MSEQLPEPTEEEKQQVLDLLYESDKSEEEILAELDAMPEHLQAWADKEAREFLSILTPADPNLGMHPQN